MMNIGDERTDFFFRFKTIERVHNSNARLCCLFEDGLVYWGGDRIPYFLQPAWNSLLLNSSPLSYTICTGLP